MAVEVNDGKTCKSFVQAVCEKFVESMDEPCDIQLYVPKKGPAKVTESGDLILPRILHLTSCDIDQSGDSSEIRRMCVNVRELDLTQNEFTDLTEVLKVVREIPNLSFLNLTSNPLNSGVTLNSDLDLTFPGVKQLILNNTQVDWRTLVKLMEVFPSLTELHLSLNNFTTVDVPSDLVYQSLSSLHFTKNNITEWHELKKLGHLFPNLETFIMAECQITSLGPREEIEAAFPKLGLLNMNKTCLQGWEEVDKFRHFPSLTALKLVGIPFLQQYPEKKRRELTVARLPTIQQLNGSAIKDEERADAERAFVRLFQDEESKPERFYELEARYGKLASLAKVSLAPQSTFKVKVTFEDKVEEMEIHTKQTVTEFKKFLSNFVGHPPSKWRLYYKHCLTPIGAELMKYPNKNLYSYNVEDGDEFIVELKETPSVQNYHVKFVS